jgi:hypothetical protein
MKINVDLLVFNKNIYGNWMDSEDNAKAKIVGTVEFSVLEYLKEREEIPKYIKK